MNELINRSPNVTFDSLRHTDENGQEYWLARELMPLLGYQRWESAYKVIQRAIVSLQRVYPQSDDHFRGKKKKIKLASGTNKEATREIQDYKLTRYACYLIAQNGDPKKEEIALAQSYFAIQTRKQELHEQRQKDIQRLIARKRLSETEKKFSGVLNDHGVDSRGIAEIRSAGDEALFNKSTRNMKKEHINNNQAVRQLLNEKGIYPELLPAEEDIKKLQNRITPEELNEFSANSSLELSEITIDVRSVYDSNELKMIKQLIEENPGDTKLNILFGNILNPRQGIRDIELNSKTIEGLKKYFFNG